MVAQMEYLLDCGPTGASPSRLELGGIIESLRMGPGAFTFRAAQRPLIDAMIASGREP